MMRYIGVNQLACDLLFGWWLVSWFVSRHILFTFVIVSTYTDLPRLVPFEWSPHLGRYLSKPYWVIFCACLTSLAVWREATGNALVFNNLFHRSYNSRGSE